MYLLIMELSKEIKIDFGKFKKGKEFRLEPGHYLYLGSAMKNLPSRLIRHTLRSEKRPAHEIQKESVKSMIDLGFIIKEPDLSEKKLHWHIDYLLDNSHISIAQINMFMTNVSLEAKMGNFLKNSLNVEQISTGLGASDHYGNSHILKILDLNWFTQNEGENLKKLFDELI